MRPASRSLFAPSNPPVWRAAYLLPLVAALAACGAQGPRATDSLPPDASAQTVQLAQLKDMLDGIEPTVDVTANALRPAPLIGRGFAQVAAQPGQTLNQRRLLAMRAARMEALRDLTEQVHGLRLRSDSLLRDAVLRDDTVAAQVQGTLRGARTTAIEPRGEDGYVVTLELDTDTVAYVLRALGERP
jgi:outer membrane protein FlgP